MELTSRGDDILTTRTSDDFDLAINIDSNRLEMLVTDTASTRMLRGLDNDPMVNVVIVPALSEPTQVAYAGYALSTCTAGFTVRQGDTGVGITTAGHCVNNQAVGGNPLGFVNEVEGTMYDFQWHRDSQISFPNHAYDGQAGGSTPYYRNITAKKHRDLQNKGDFVCKYGKTTGYNCGEILYRDYAPTYIRRATMTFIVAGRPGGGRFSDGGDSGGPVYSNGTALGLVSGRRGNGDMIYMAQNYLGKLNLRVKLQ